jgi:nucleoside-diphosphate-sugar epimerase
MSDKKKTILITGAYGFVGTNISNALKDNYNLWALDIEEKKSEAYTRFFKWKI